LIWLLVLIHNSQKEYSTQIESILNCTFVQISRFRIFIQSKSLDRPFSFQRFTDSKVTFERDTKQNTLIVENVTDKCECPTDPVRNQENQKA